MIGVETSYFLLVVSIFQGNEHRESFSQRNSNSVARHNVGSNSLVFVRKQNVDAKCVVVLQRT
jgi:hypothetical protein